MGDDPEQQELSLAALQQMEGRFSHEVQQLEDALENVANDDSSPLAGEDAQAVIAEISGALKRSYRVLEDLHLAMAAFTESQRSGRHFTAQELDLFRFFGFRSPPAATATLDPAAHAAAVAWQGEDDADVGPEPETDVHDMYHVKPSPEVYTEGGSQVDGEREGWRRSWSPSPSADGLPGTARRSSGPSPRAGAPLQPARGSGPQRDSASEDRGQRQVERSARRDSASQTAEEMASLLDSAPELEERVGELVRQRSELRVQEERERLERRGAELARREARLAQLDQEAAQTAKEASAALAEELLDARGELGRARDEAAQLAAQVQELQGEGAALRGELAAARGQLQQLAAERAAAAARAAELEVRLREAAQPARAEAERLQAAAQELRDVAALLGREDEEKTAMLQAFTAGETARREEALQAAERAAAAAELRADGQREELAAARRSVRAEVQRLGDQLAAVDCDAQAHAALVGAASQSASDLAAEMDAALHPFVYSAPAEQDGGAPDGSPEAALDAAVAEVLNQLECPVAVDCLKVGAGEYQLDRRVSVVLGDGGVVYVRLPSGARERLLTYLCRLYAPFFAPPEQGPSPPPAAAAAEGAAQAGEGAPLDPESARDLERLQQQQRQLLAQLANGGGGGTAERKECRAAGCAAGGASSRSSSALSAHHSYAALYSGHLRPRGPSGGGAPPAAPGQRRGPGRSGSSGGAGQQPESADEGSAAAPPPSPPPDSPATERRRRRQQQQQQQQQQAQQRDVVPLLRSLFAAADEADITLVTKRQLRATCARRADLAASIAAALHLPAAAAGSPERAAAQFEAAVVDPIQGGPEREVTFNCLLRHVAEHVQRRDAAARRLAEDRICAPSAHSPPAAAALEEQAAHSPAPPGIAPPARGAEDGPLFSIGSDPRAFNAALQQQQREKVREAFNGQLQQRAHELVSALQDPPPTASPRPGAGGTPARGRPLPRLSPQRTRPASQRRGAAPRADTRSGSADLRGAATPPPRRPGGGQRTSSPAGAPRGGSAALHRAVSARSAQPHAGQGALYGTPVDARVEALKAEALRQQVAELRRGYILGAAPSHRGGRQQPGAATPRRT